PEGRSSSWKTFHSHRSLLSLDQLLTEVEAQTQTLSPATLDRSLGDLIQALPDIGLLLKRQTWSPILDPNPNEILCLDDTNLYRFGQRRKFEGIGQVVAQHLLNSVSIRTDSDLVLFGQVQCDETVRMSGLIILDRFIHQPDQVKDDQTQLHLVFSDV